MGAVVTPAPPVAEEPRVRCAEIWLWRDGPEALDWPDDDEPAPFGPHLLVRKAGGGWRTTTGLRRWRAPVAKTRSGRLYILEPNGKRSEAWLVQQIVAAVLEVDPAGLSIWPIGEDPEDPRWSLERMPLHELKRLMEGGAP